MFTARILAYAVWAIVLIFAGIQCLNTLSGGEWNEVREWLAATSGWFAGIAASGAAWIAYSQLRHLRRTFDMDMLNQRRGIMLQLRATAATLRRAERGIIQPLQTQRAEIAVLLDRPYGLGGLGSIGGLDPNEPRKPEDVLLERFRTVQEILERNLFLRVSELTADDIEMPAYEIRLRATQDGPQVRDSLWNRFAKYSELSSLSPHDQILGHEVVGNIDLIIDAIEAAKKDFSEDRRSLLGFGKMN